MSDLIEQNTPDLFETSQHIVTPLSGPKWMLVLTGIVRVNFSRGPDTGWAHRTVNIFPNLLRPLATASLDQPEPGSDWGFAVEQHTAMGTLSAISDRHHADHSGFAIDKALLLDEQGKDGKSYLKGVQLNLALYGDTTSLIRVGYQIMAVGEYIQVKQLAGA